VENGEERLWKTHTLKSPVWLLVLTDKTPSVRTCGLKPSTLKQLGQPIQHPSGTGELKVRPAPKRRGCLGIWSLVFNGLKPQVEDRPQFLD
jgi:hypothetical protein